MRPSGSHAGWACVLGDGDSRRTVPVPTVSRNNPRSPSRVEANASVCPSGLQAGSTSVDAPVVSGTSAPPPPAMTTIAALPNWVVTTATESPARDHAGLAWMADAKLALPLTGAAALPSDAADHR